MRITTEEHRLKIRAALNTPEEKAKRSKRMRELNLNFTKEKACINCNKKFIGRLKKKICSPECTWENTLKRKYKINRKQYDAIVKKQKGKCAICLKEKTLVIDHCHKEGHVRGLLCSVCNQALYYFDDEALNKRVNDYLHAS